MSSLFRHWPVRWRIAGVSAGLTFVILLGFALIVGKLASDRLQHDFEEELQAGANSIASSVNSILTTGGVPENELERLDALKAQGYMRIVRGDGRVVATSASPDLGPPRVESVVDVGELSVATTLANPNQVSNQPVFVQYAESRDGLESTIGRLWLLLGIGVFGGTLLATLAGLAVANRAMRPIAGLTAAAREVAMTRDPSVGLPMPESEDEVAELARTLDSMLRELDAARGEREQMIQAQRDFVADASHELRTPLTSILANLELLEERLARTGGDPEAEEIVEAALGSSKRMRRLVSDLLLLARADAGRSGPRRECDLARIAAAALGEVKPIAGDHAIVVDAHGPLTVEGNPDDLHRLVVNLLENAVRHTPAGTRIALSATARDGEAVLEVGDDGPGLPPGVGDRIFSRFVRGDGPGDLSLDSGTGLGLAIVKAVADAHGGGVEAGESAHGGARFTVRLPMAEPALAPSGREPAPAR